jgi:hypothetical protein
MAKSIPHVPRLVVVGRSQIFHFKNAAAKARAAVDEKVLAVAADSDKKLRALIAGQFVKPVPLTILSLTYVKREPRSVRPRAAVPTVLGRRRSPYEFVSFVIDMAGFNRGRGFRQPSIKAKNWKSTSLVEQASIGAGLMEPLAFERSKRGERKLEAHAAMVAAIAAERSNGIDPKYLSAHARRRLAA